MSRFYQYVQIGLISLMLVSSSLALADDTNDSEPECKPRPATREFFSLGMYQYDADDLNARLKAAHFEEFDSNQLAFGFGGYSRFSDRFVGDLDFYYFSKDGSGTGTYQTRMNGGFATASVGYVLTKHRYFNMFPYVGIGLGIQRLNVWSTTSVSFDDMLSQPTGNADFWAPSVGLTFGFHTDYLIPLEVKTKRESGLVVGLRASYALAIYKGDWSLTGRDVDHAPEANPSGFNVRLVVGWGDQPTPKEVDSGQ